MIRKFGKKFFSTLDDPHAHSPFNKAIRGTLEKRSELFPERTDIPGRRAKYVIAMSFVLNMIGWKNWIEVQRIFKWQEAHTKKQQRKAAPFLQAMEDIRYLAMEDRSHILIDELFSKESDEFRANLKSPYFQKDIWFKSPLIIGLPM